MPTATKKHSTFPRHNKFLPLFFSQSPSRRSVIPVSVPALAPAAAPARNGHRIPRPRLNRLKEEDEEETEDRSRPRSRLSSQSAADLVDPPVDPESSILVSKLSTATPTGSVLHSSMARGREGSGGSDKQRAKRVTITTKSEFGKRDRRAGASSPVAATATATHRHSHVHRGRRRQEEEEEEEEKDRTNGEAGTAMNSIGLGSGLLSPLLGAEELEANLRRLRPSQVGILCDADCMVPEV